jgi:hypothetical protein
MEILFEAPEHGWVNLSIRDAAFSFEDSISDVPSDFVDQTVVGITNILKSGSACQVFLSLEPDYYVVMFAKDETLFTFTLEQEIQFVRSSLYQTKGTFSEILLPFIEAFQKFYGSHIAEPHWPECDPKNMAKLLEIADKYQANLR